MILIIGNPHNGGLSGAVEDQRRNRNNHGAPADESVVGRGSAARAPDNVHLGPHALELADPARPEVTQFVVAGSVVSVVLLVVLLVRCSDSGWPT
jgi:hypothetical protein